MGKRSMTFLRLLAGLVAIVAVLAGLAVYLNQVGAALTTSLPVLVVASLILLLGTLSIVSMAFALYGIADRNQALGLPEGSIRAVIALSLIVLLSVLSVYFYGSMTDGRLESVRGLSDGEAAGFVTSLPTGSLLANVADGQQRHTIYFRDLPSVASNDFAKQLVTLLGTLVTAIASFYFGSQSVSQAVSATKTILGTATSGAPPNATAVSPAKGARGSVQTLTISGANLGGVTAASLRLGTRRLDLTGVTSNTSLVTGAVNIAADADLGTYDVAVTVGDADYILAAAFTITDGSGDQARPVGDKPSDDGLGSTSIAGGETTTKSTGAAPKGGVSHAPGNGALDVRGAAPAAVSPRGPEGSVAPEFRYHGGTILKNGNVYLSFWGDAWANDPAHQEMARNLVEYLKDLSAGPFMNVLHQYGVDPPTIVSDAKVGGVSGVLSELRIGNILQSCIDHGQIPDPTAGDVCVMVFLQQGGGAEISGEDGDVRLCEPTNDNAFGFHSRYTTSAGNALYYAVAPWIDDGCLKATCPDDAHCTLHQSQSQLERQTQVVSHEFAEMLTNPDCVSGWYAGDAGHEVADQGAGQSALMQVAGRSWRVQLIYSKANDTGAPDATPFIAQAASPVPLLAGAPT